jgi:type III secretory pathway component EscS
MTKTQILIIMLPPVATIIAVVIGVLINDFRLGQIDGQILGMRSRLTRHGPAQR